MTPLRILFPYTGGSVGGSHVSSLILARALREAGHTVVLGLHRPGGALQDYLEAAGLNWISLPDTPAPKLRPLWRQWRARRRVQSVLSGITADYDIVHTHDMRNHLLWAAATEGGPAHVWHQRTPAPGKAMAVWGARAAAFIAVSRFTHQSLPAALHQKARVIYNPFETQQLSSPQARAALREELGVAKETAVVGYIANFSDRKRPELMVEIAARSLFEAEQPIVFCMFGAPLDPWASRVRARAEELGLGGGLRILGTRHPFAPIMAGLSALVAPARDEALGRTLIEAGFAGVPLIASDEGGNREIVDHGKTGLLVPPDDVAGFTQALLGTLSDPETALARAKAAQDKVAATFSLATHLAAIEDVYAEITGRG